MSLAGTIKSAVVDGRYVVGIHARQRLTERKVKLWQVESGLKEGRILYQRPDSEPNPSIVVGQMLSDGTPVTVVWSWLEKANLAKLVTVYFPNRGET